jgi:hemerythrin
MLNWSHDYETGNPRIDLQHETFLGLVNEFQQIGWLATTRTNCAGPCGKSADYATFHFHSEENVMTDSGYPRSGGAQTASLCFAGNPQQQGVGSADGTLRR